MRPHCPEVSGPLPRPTSHVPRDEKGGSRAWRHSPTAPWDSIWAPPPGLLVLGPGAPPHTPACPPRNSPPRRPGRRPRAPAVLARPGPAPGPPSPLALDRPPSRLGPAALPRLGTRPRGGGVGNCGPGKAAAQRGFQGRPGARELLPVPGRFGGRPCRQTAGGRATLGGPRGPGWASGPRKGPGLRSSLKQGWKAQGCWDQPLTVPENEAPWMPRHPHT